MRRVGLCLGRRSMPRSYAWRERKRKREWDEMLGWMPAPGAVETGQVPRDPGWFPQAERKAPSMGEPRTA